MVAFYDYMYEVFLVNTAVEEQTIRKNIKKQKFQLSRDEAKRT